MGGVPDDALAQLITSHAEDVPAFLELVAHALHKHTDFFATPTWQSILNDRFRPPSSSTTSVRFSMNSTVNSIPASPEPDVPVSQNRHARRPHTSSISTATSNSASAAQLPVENGANVSSKSINLDDRVIASKTPDPEEFVVNPRCSSVSRYSFDIPETQAFPGGDDTIPETQAFVRPASSSSRPTSAADDQTDDAFFFDAADDDVCTFNETQSQMLPVSPAPIKSASLPADATLLDDDVDDELSALQWNDESVVDGGLKGEQQLAVRPSTITPDIDFDAATKIDNDLRKENGSATPDLDLEMAAVVEQPPAEPSPQTNTSVRNDAHVFIAPAAVQPDIFDDCTQPFVPVRPNANNSNFPIGLNDETQPFVLTKPAAVFATALDTDDEDIFAMETQKVAAVAAKDDVDDRADDDDLYAQATQAMPPVEHWFVKPELPVGGNCSSIGVDRKRRTKKPLTLPKEILLLRETLPKVSVVIEKLPDNCLAVYDADTQPMEVDGDDVYAAETQRIDAGVGDDDDDFYNQPTQAITKLPTEAVAPWPLPDRTSPAQAITTAKPLVRRSTSEEVDTPDFDFIRMADPRKILEAEEAFREKCRQQPHKKLLFVDSSDEEETTTTDAAEGRNSVKSNSARSNATADAPVSTKHSTKGSKTEAAASHKKRVKNDTPDTASRSSKSVASTSAQNMTTFEPNLSAEPKKSNKSLVRKEIVQPKTEPEPEPVRKTSRRIAEKRRESSASSEGVVPRKRGRPRKEETTASDEGGERSEHKKKSSRAATVKSPTPSVSSTRGASKQQSSPSETKENFDQGKPVEIRRGRLRANNEDTTMMSHHNKKRSALHTSTTSETETATTRNSSGRSSRESSKSKSYTHPPTSSPGSRLPNEQHPQSRTKRPASHNTLLRHPRILFTVIDPTQYSDQIKRMGGQIVQTPAECQVLVTDRVYRTYKFLCAIATGSHIVSESWLQACVERRQFVDVQEFALRDERSEARFHFRLDKTLAAARERKIFAGHSVYVTPSTKPPPQELKSIIGAAGGHCLLKMDRAPHKDHLVVVISDAADAHMWPQLRIDHPDVQICNTEGVMMSVLQQRLLLKSYRFK